MTMQNYISYYQTQIGGGSKTEFGPLYYTPRFVQQGRGFANFFSSIYSYLKPLFKSGFEALKNTAIKTGSSMLSEIGSRPFKDILIDHGKKAKDDLEQRYLKKFQDGKGIFSFAKSKKNINKKQTTKSGKVKKNKSSARKKTKNRILDIFSKKKK